MRFYSHLNSAMHLLSTYNGSEPFASYIKPYFAANKKHGSKDRKQISHLCYCYFRIGKALMDIPVKERIITGLFLCSPGPNELLEHLRPEWNIQAHLSLPEKIILLNHPSLIDEVFPWKEELSEHIDHEKLNSSFFIQPDLFIRIRPGKEEAVISKLKEKEIAVNPINPSCIALLNTTKIENVVELNEEVVIQDYSSQRVAEFLHAVPPGRQLSVWDCCAASGGKSILAKDVLGNIDLTVSDIRESILVNLQKRFREAGIKNYKSFVADISSPGFNMHGQLFDLVIADVPCTGSGTWSRTPEQLYYFNKEAIERYSSLQKKIVSNAIPSVKPGGYFLYITCSVFKKENEGMVDFITQNLQLEIVKMENLLGYEKKADTLFAALLRKPV